MSEPSPPSAATANWQQRLQQRLLLLSYYHAIVFGLISQRFDFRSRRITRSVASKLYAAAVACCIIVLVPPTVVHAWHAFQLVGDNVLLQHLNVINGLLQMLVMMLALAFRALRERALLPVVTDLLQLEQHYFDAVSRCGAQCAAMRQHFQRLLFVKCFGIAFQLFCTVCSVLRFAELSVRTLLMLVHLVAIMNVLNGVMWHYYLLLWHMARRFGLLNVQLQRIVNLLQVQQRRQAANARRRQQTRRLQRCIAAEVDRIALTHYRLTHAVLRLNACYQYPIVALLLSLVTNNVSMSYFAVILFARKTSSIQMGHAETIVAVVSYAVIMLDMFLLHVICDSIIWNAQQTAVVLQQFQELKQLDVMVERSCNLLAQQLRQHKVRINIAGMFDLNKRVALVMFSELITSTVFLVQWDLQMKQKKMS